jgi:aspartyl-tRNA(Asn)/glutamyl-tRNA(Gln) amidotransferase subunit A
VTGPARRPDLDPELHTACAIADAVRAGRLSAVEVMDRYLERIDACNPELNGFVYLDREGARARAALIDRAVARGDDPGLLAGVPVGIKDTEDCAGMPTTHGSIFYRGRPPAAADSSAVALLRAAGAIPVGKTAVPELSLHSITWSEAWGTTRNPWDPALTPGGSSGGASAAVASGMVPLATATDAGGSTRSPAAFTGLVGLKPTQGRIPLDAPVDLMAKSCLSLTVRDTARFLDQTSYPTLADRTSLPHPTERYEDLIERLDVRGLRVAWSDDLGFIPTEPECISVARQAAETLASAAGLEWRDEQFTIPNPGPAWVPAFLLPIRGDLELDGIWPARRDQLTPRARLRLDAVDRITPVELARAARLRTEVEAMTAALFERVDLLMTPVTTVVSLPAEGPIPEEIAGRDARLTGAEAHLTLANLTWQPAISVPAGLGRAGTPIGLHVMAPRGRDDVLLRLARIFEQAAPWPHFAPRYRPA